MKPFESIIDEHGAVVLRVCRALLQPIDADEAWSETFLAAFRSYPNLQNHDNIRGWLVTIAHHKAIDLLRNAQRQAIPIDETIGNVTYDLESIAMSPHRGVDFSADVSADIDVDELRIVIATLPNKQRRAITYRYLADLSYADIGKLLECSQAAARRSVSDGLAALRRTAVKEKDARNRKLQ